MRHVELKKPLDLGTESMLLSSQECRLAIRIGDARVGSFIQQHLDDIHLHIDWDSRLDRDKQWCGTCLGLGYLGSRRPPTGNSPWFHPPFTRGVKGSLPIRISQVRISTILQEEGRHLLVPFLACEA